MKVYANDPLLIASGVSPYQVATHGWWFAKRPDGTHDTSKISTEIVGFHTRKFANTPGPLLIDIEAWNFETDHSIVAEQLPIAVKCWRDVSKRELGFYAHIPERDWWTPLNWWNAVGTGEANAARIEMTKWMDRNTRNAAEFLPLFDFVCPSIYAFYPDKFSDWRIYAELNITEAYRVSAGKPVRPILYPRLGDGSLIELSEWSQMIAWIASCPMAESLMVFADSEPTWRDAVTAVIGTK